MKIIDQSHKILSVPANLLTTIELAGRTCYKTEDKITDASSTKFVEMLISKGHHAMIEFGDIIVRFITNRGVTHELVRHRLCSFAQESTRYVTYNGDMEFIRPIWFDSWSPLERLTWYRQMEESEKAYKTLIEAGSQAQQAREVLPNSLKTEIVVKCNIREWRYLFTLRCSKAAHPQIRELMIKLLKDLKTKLPVVFDDIQY